MNDLPNFQPGKDRNLLDGIHSAGTDPIELGFGEFWHRPLPLDITQMLRPENAKALISEVIPELMKLSYRAGYYQALSDKDKNRK